MTPADEIRTAAAKLRTLAAATSTDTDGTPTTHWNSKDQGHGRSLLCGSYTTNGRGEQVGWPSLVRGGSFQRPSYMHTQHADYAAAMDPTVGLLLADLLDDMADGDDAGEINPWALTLARELNAKP
ncbi:hypothetical protein [Streptomyces sp. SCL15-4]|uniref:hypothetical protein n=1 Tax=Streptomyces sp. SCL15-4 TaxID=2967221 RepID=UPI0029661C3B|nr:hypothetical protein [Streptomyces sp. SCL15-4]